MARASILTWLPLDQWARILGVNPYHFNGIELDSSPAQFCNKIWCQHSWQDADRVGREEIAGAISQAEIDIVDMLGFFPLPSYTESEIQRLEHPHDVTQLFYSSMADQRGMKRPVQTKWGKVISGGIEAASLIDTATIAGATMAFVDIDGDGYAETCRIILPTTVTDTNEIRVYYAGHDRDATYEIRPLRSVTITAGNVVILLDRAQCVDPDVWEAIDVSSVDGDATTDFVVSLEVWRVYLDPSDHGAIQWEALADNLCGCSIETCDRCTWGEQTICMQTRDPELGIVTYHPATWDATDEEYDSASLAYSRGPNRIRLNYLSGYQGRRIARPYCDIDPTLARIIAIYSLTLVDRPVCECSNVQGFFDRWREDLALTGEQGSYQVAARSLECPWGTKAGAVWAWRQLQRYKIMKAARY